MKIQLISLPFILLLMSCSIGGQDRTLINNISKEDTLIVELYKSKLNAKNFEIMEEEICIRNDTGGFERYGILYHELWIGENRAVIYKSLNTIPIRKTNHCHKYEYISRIDGIKKLNQVEILSFNGEKLHLRFHILPKNYLVIGNRSFISDSKASLDWDKVVIYKKGSPDLEIEPDSIKNYITSFYSDISCGDCGLDNQYKLEIK